MTQFIKRCSDLGLSPGKVIKNMLEEFLILSQGMGSSEFDDCLKEDHIAKTVRETNSKGEAEVWSGEDVHSSEKQDIREKLEAYDAFTSTRTYGWLN